MINPNRFAAPWIYPETIRTTVDGIRSEYPVCSRLPLDILVFAEHDLGLEFDFKPIRQFGQDAFLRHDLRGIVFDNDAFAAQSVNRLRFSVAHELGHLYLHKDIYGKVRFENVEEWLDFFEQVPPDQYQRVEWQADEFAGQLLMPVKELSAALEETIGDAEREGYFPLGPEAVLEFCCRSMHRDFGVSQQAMSTRLHRDKLWPHRKVAVRSGNSV
ncbi:MAG: ImmA/IrrE family metallo-endopeptidase [Verrucomicrobiota bacterium]